MAKKNVGTLIKEARTAAGLSQAALAKAAGGLSAPDIGKAERGEKELTQAQLKAVAKALGITQKSLLEAPKGGTNTSGAAAAKKPASSGTSSSGKKTGSKKSGGITLTAAEKELVEAYRKADDDTKEAVMNLLKGEKTEDLTSVLLSGAANGLGSLLGLFGKRDMPREE